MAVPKKISQFPTDAAPARTDFLTSLENGILNVKGLVSSFLGLTLDTDLTFSNNTTGDVSIVTHGFTPKAPNDITSFLRGDATWAQPGLIQDQLLVASASSISFTSIPATYRHLYCLLTGRTDIGGSSEDFCYLQFNNDSGANYDYEGINFNNAATSFAAAYGQTRGRLSTLASNSASANRAGLMAFFVADYTGVAFHKLYHVIGGSVVSTSGNNATVRDATGLWRSATAINRLDLFPESGNFIAGTRATLFGM